MTKSIVATLAVCSYLLGSLPALAYPSAVDTAVAGMRGAPANAPLHQGPGAIHDVVRDRLIRTEFRHAIERMFHIPMSEIRADRIHRWEWNSIPYSNPYDASYHAPVLPLPAGPWSEPVYLPQ